MIHVFNSTLPGAPVLSGTAGALVAVLDACLVDGWGVGVVDGVVITAGVATVTRAAGHSLGVSSVAEIAGATTSGGSINGQQKVLSVSSTSYTFATACPNQTASGTITHKLAAAGWAKPYGGATLAVYRSLDVSGTQACLRVSDSGTTSARVVGYESMSDVDAGVGPFPTEVQVAGGLWWAKSTSTDTAPRPWTLVADSRGVYLLTWYYDPIPGYSAVVGFGDFRSHKPADGYAAMLTGALSANTGNTPTNLGQAASSYSYGAGTSGWAPRGVGGLGGAVPVAKIAGCAGTGGSTALQSGNSSAFAHYPNAADNGLYLADFMLYETGGTVCFRGVSAGAYFCPQNLGLTTFPTGALITGVSSLPGRDLIALNTGESTMFVDATGPWER